MTKKKLRRIIKRQAAEIEALRTENARHNAVVPESFLDALVESYGKPSPYRAVFNTDPLR